MATVIQLPKLMESMQGAKIVAWCKREGDRVEQDDLLAEIETDKATMELRAQTGGTLLKVLVGAENEVVIGEALAIIGAPGEDVRQLLAIHKTKPGPTKEPPKPAATTTSARCKFCNRKNTPGPHTLCEHCGAPL